MGILKSFSDEQRVEDVEGRPRSGQGADAAVVARLGEQRVEVTEEDVGDQLKSWESGLMLMDIVQDKRIRRKTDRVILTILVWIYFLQVRNSSEYLTPR